MSTANSRQDVKGVFLLNNSQIFFSALRDILFFSVKKDFLRFAGHTVPKLARLELSI